MPHGELIINGYDAYDRWGMSMDNTSLSQLMAPAPMKDMIVNRSRLENGTRRVRTGRKYDERTIKLGLHIHADTDAGFRTLFNKFKTEVLDTGQLDIQVSYVPQTVYRCDYLSCSTFGVYGRQLANFVLTLVESNPENREVQ